MTGLEGRNGGLTLYRQIPVSAFKTIDIEETEAASKAAEAAEKKEGELEADFYPRVVAWAVTKGYKPIIVGGKISQSKWLNPDVISVIGEYNDFHNSIAYEVASFEVKLRVEPQAVWQAANYLTYSDIAFVAFCKSEDEIRDKEEVFQLAIKHGLGILAYEDNSFKIIQNPRRHIPEEAETEAALARFSKSVPEIEKILTRTSANHAYGVLAKVMPVAPPYPEDR